MANGQLVHLLVVANDNQMLDWLISTLRSEPGILLVGWTHSLQRAAELAGQRAADLVLLDMSALDARPMERLQALPAPFLMVDPAEIASMQQAILARAHGFLLKPFTEAQLLETVRQAFTVIVQQRPAASHAASRPLAS